MADQTIKGLEMKRGLDGSKLRILIVHTRWNSAVVDKLTQGCKQTLITNGVKPENITIIDVPGAFELPFACQTLLKKSLLTPTPFDACIPIGVLIKGSTMHFEYIAESTTQGIMRVGLDLQIPVVFGVLTCLNDDQALARAGVEVKGIKGHNHGIDWATAAIEMATLNQ